MCVYVNAEVRGQPQEFFHRNSPICFETGSTLELAYRLGYADWPGSPMDLPVSDSLLLVLQMCATKLSFCVGTEGHTLDGGLLTELSSQALFGL